nr:hypothetical protein Iba_chr03bCG18190 [Ipomoea batatas]
MPEKAFMAMLEPETLHPSSTSAELVILELMSGCEYITSVGSGMNSGNAAVLLLMLTGKAARGFFRLGGSFEGNLQYPSSRDPGNTGGDPDPRHSLEQRQC